MGTAPGGACATNGWRLHKWHRAPPNIGCRAGSRRRNALVFDALDHRRAAATWSDLQGQRPPRATSSPAPPPKIWRVVRKGGIIRAQAGRVQYASRSWRWRRCSRRSSVFPCTMRSPVRVTAKPAASARAGSPVADQLVAGLDARGPGHGFGEPCPADRERGRLR
jgi:hypothetical protein